MVDIGHFIACLNILGGVEEKLTNDEEAQKAKKGYARARGAVGERRRRTEQEEDAELLKDGKQANKR